jgi:hypothetical protein
MGLKVQLGPDPWGPDLRVPGSDPRVTAQRRYMVYNPPCIYTIVTAHHLHVDPYSLFGHEYTVLTY